MNKYMRERRRMDRVRYLRRKEKERRYFEQFKAYMRSTGPSRIVYRGGNAHYGAYIDDCITDGISATYGISKYRDRSVSEVMVARASDPVGEITGTRVILMA